MEAHSEARGKRGHNDEAARVVSMLSAQQRVCLDYQAVAEREHALTAYLWHKLSELFWSSDLPLQRRFPP